VLCLAVVSASGLSGCRPRVAADHNAPAVSPAASSAASPSGSIDQQDVDNLTGILASAGGAVTSVRSAMSADGPTPKG
jgi:hypothetical protein